MQELNNQYESLSSIFRRWNGPEATAEEFINHPFWKEVRKAPPQLRQSFVQHFFHRSCSKWVDISYSEREKVFFWLFEKGVDVNAKETYFTFNKESDKFEIKEEKNDGCTPLREVLYRAFIPLVRFLILQGALITNFRVGETYRHKRENVITTLIELGVGGLIPSGESLLIHNCVRREFLDIVKTFFGQGISPNQKDQNGHTLLQAACYAGKGFMVARLIELGADRDIHISPHPFIDPVSGKSIGSPLLKRDLYTTGRFNPCSFCGSMDVYIKRQYSMLTVCRSCAFTRRDDMSGYFYKSVKKALEEADKKEVINSLVDSEFSPLIYDFLGFL